MTLLVFRVDPNTLFFPRLRLRFRYMPPPSLQLIFLATALDNKARYTLGTYNTIHCVSSIVLIHILS